MFAPRTVLEYAKVTLKRYSLSDAIERYDRNLALYKY